jgi:ribosome-associated protein
MITDPTPDPDVIEGPSKSELKREMHARQRLGEKLTKLSAAQLAKIPLSDSLRDAIKDYQRFPQREAKRRQLQFVGRLMRDADCDAIEHAWQLTQAGSEASRIVQHRLEHWRDRLIAEGDEAVNALLVEYPAIDRQPLRQLIREALREQKENKPPAARRKLFQYIKPYLVD